MLRAKKILKSGWGGYPAAECSVYRPEKEKEVARIINSGAGGLIPRGAGRSYGDAALAENIIASERLNRFISFDSEKGIITAEAGVTLAEIINITVMKGWFPPVIPGTKYVSLGGAIASNVHGKNQYRAGDFAEHILNIKLCLPSGETIDCSAEQNPEIFAATAGGMGMTGYIQQATLRLMPIESASLSSWRVRVKNIEEMAALFRENKNSAEYMIGWIDHFGKGANLGRGIFEKSSHSKVKDGLPLGKYEEKHSRLSVPKFFPAFILNRYSMAIYNRFRFLGVSKKGRLEKRDFSEFFHPLDSINNWQRLYGKKGLLQYQFLIPEGKNAVIDMQNILHMIQESGLFSFLAVIKYHRPGKGPMTFSREGFSIALDFPASAKVFELLDKLDKELCKISGRIYLAKDARAKSATIEKMYGTGFSAWKKIINRLDPENKFNSGLAKRLGFKDE